MYMDERNGDVDIRNDNNRGLHIKNGGDRRRSDENNKILVNNDDRYK
jgi:hypothetical protein